MPDVPQPSVQHPAHLATQYAVARILAEASSTADALPRLLEAVGQTLGWEWGALWWEESQEQGLRGVAVWHAPNFDPAALEAETRRITFPRGIGLPGRVWASGQVSWIPDLQADPNFPRAPVAAAVGLRGAVAFPIFLGSQALGVVEFFSRSVQPRDEALLDLLRAISSQVGQFLARQTALERLKESEARKAAILEAALDCVIAIDHQGRITDFNPAAERTFGYDREDVLGKELAETIIPVALREAHRRGLAHYLATGEGPVLSQRIEITGMRASGEEFPVELTIRPLEVQGQPAFVGYLRDITERKQAEEALRESERQREHFLAVISHDLKNPLTAIMGQVGLLRRRLRSGQEVPPERLTGVLESIDRTAKRMGALIQELVDVGSLGAGQPLDLQVASTDLVALVEQIVADNQQATERHTLRLEPASSHLIGLFDPVRVQQVIDNMVANAIKYSPEGGDILLQVGQEQDARGAWAVVAVRDQGVGIPAADLSRIFERYHRASNVEGLAPGTGLGLAGAKQIVEQHGGTISVESEEGRGSTLTVRLPLLTA